MKQIALIIIGLVLFSCEDFLVLEPTTESSEFEFFQDVDNARLAVNGVYDPLSWGESTQLGSGGHSYYFIIGDICTDDSEKGSTDSDQPGIRQLKNFTANSGSSNLSVLWSKHFIAIARANQVISNLEGSTIDASVKLELEAEVKFIRAYSYFTLIRIFGGVPLFTSPVTPAQINEKAFSRAPLYEVYAQIEQDLQFGMDNLPQKGVREIGRANQGAAAAYMARVLMYQIGTDNTNGHTWDEVLKITDDFMAGSYGAYNLTPNYATIFELEGENNAESIFEIQAVDTGTGPYERGPYVGSQWSVFQHPQSMGGWGFNTPTTDLVSVYEANDPRRPCTALAVGEFAHGVEMIVSERNKTGYYHRKAIMNPDEWVTEKGSSYNIRKFRYADILLMNAEAAFHTGNNGQALARLTEIRNRASQSTYPKGWDAVDPTGYTATGFAALDNALIPGSGQALLDFIYAERRREFGMEQLRFWDLVRTGRYVPIMEAKYGIGSAAENHAITSANKESSDQVIVNPIPVFPIPALEVSDWGISQNRNYN